MAISGEAEKIAKACELAKAKGAKRALPLPVAGAYHSRLMTSAKTKVQGMLATVEMSAPKVPVISNVTAQPHSTTLEIAARLVDQVTSSVRWEDSMRYLLAQGFTRFIELGPGNALTGFMKRIDKNAQSLNVADMASLQATASALGARHSCHCEGSQIVPRAYSDATKKTRRRNAGLCFDLPIQEKYIYACGANFGVA